MSESNEDRVQSVGVASVTLLHPITQVLLPAAAIPLSDLQSRARLLRLLALAQGHFFSTGELAIIFGVEEQSVAPMVKDLRRRLGGSAWGNVAITTKPGDGYGLIPELVQVDAHSFRAMLRALPILSHGQVKEPDDLDPQIAEESLTTLDTALELWRGNPARGLESITYDEHRYHAEYDQLHLDARWLRTLCALRVGTMWRLRQSITDLERAVQPKQEPDLESWCLLIRAYFSTGNLPKVHQTFSDASGYYKDVLHQTSVPAPIAACYKRANSGDETFSLYRDKIRLKPIQSARPLEGATSQSPSLDDSNLAQLVELVNDLEPLVSPEHRHLVSLLSELVTVMNTIGVSTASVLKLQGSRVEPKQCLRRVQTQLWFSGVLASKWVDTAAIRSDFDDLLTVLDHRDDSDVRMMILDPEGPGYKRLFDMRKGRLSAEHLPHLAQLAKKHPSLQVRVFDHLPTFRILVIDNDFVTFSFYRLDELRYLESDGGMEAPHIVLDPLAPWPLAEAFTGLYAESWNTATALDLDQYAV